MQARRVDQHPSAPERIHLVRSESKIIFHCCPSSIEFIISASNASRLSRATLNWSTRFLNSNICKMPAYVWYAILSSFFCLLHKIISVSSGFIFLHRIFHPTTTDVAVVNLRTSGATGAPIIMATSAKSRTALTRHTNWTTIFIDGQSACTCAHIFNPSPSIFADFLPILHQSASIRPLTQKSVFLHLGCLQAP